MKIAGEQEPGVGKEKERSCHWNTKREASYNQTSCCLPTQTELSTASKPSLGSSKGKGPTGRAAQQQVLEEEPLRPFRARRTPAELQLHQGYVTDTRSSSPEATV